MCFRNASGIVTVETPNKQVKEYYPLFGIDVPTHVKLLTFIKEMMQPEVVWFCFWLHLRLNDCKMRVRAGLGRR